MFFQTFILGAFWWGTPAFFQKIKVWCLLQKSPQRIWGLFDGAPVAFGKKIPWAQFFRTFRISFNPFSPRFFWFSSEISQVVVGEKSVVFDIGPRAGGNRSDLGGALFLEKEAETGNTRRTKKFFSPLILLLIGHSFI